jgi:hypothetical protein
VAGCGPIEQLDLGTRCPIVLRISIHSRIFNAHVEILEPRAGVRGAVLEAAEVLRMWPYKSHDKEHPQAARADD